jgi:NTP pyrophosphatase (non-canonical NTP hydrolase)
MKIAKDQFIETSEGKHKIMHTEPQNHDSINYLTNAIRKFTEERDWDQFHSPENLAKSVAIEAGELLECFQWGQDADTEEVKEEIADVMNYCLLLSDKLGIDAGKAVYDKLQKSAAKYPVEKCKGVSTKYDRL